MADTPPPVLGPGPQLTRWQAQKQLGLVATYDYHVWTLIGALWVTLGFWKLFGTPTALHLLAFAIVNVALTQMYLVVLAFRILVMLLDVGASINLMPEAAARIVLGFWEGRRK